MLWVKLLSWHSVRLMSRGGRYVTRCGRMAPEGAHAVDLLPAERSCESCLRIVAREADQPFRPEVPA